MRSERRAVAGLRVFLVVLFAVLVLFQVMSLPGQFRFMAEQAPEMAYLRWPATVASDPGLPLLLFLLTVGVTVLGLLMIVMRALLRRASSLRADLEDVI